MVQTRVGYTGGHSPDPTYHAIGEHAEALEVVFDPERVSYTDLLALFWSSHDPTRSPSGGQYRTTIWVHSPEQRRLAEASSIAWASEHGAEVRTPIIDAGPFHPAEDYHQKWKLRQRGGRWLTWLQAIYPEPTELRDSTAAARLNGWLGGHGRGTIDGLATDLGLTHAEATVLAEQLGWQVPAPR